MKNIPCSQLQLYSYLIVVNNTTIRAEALASSFAVSVVGVGPTIGASSPCSIENTVSPLTRRNPQEGATHPP